MPQLMKKKLNTMLQSSSIQLMPKDGLSNDAVCDLCTRVESMRRETRERQRRRVQSVISP